MCMCVSLCTHKYFGFHFFFLPIVSWNVSSVIFFTFEIVVAIDHFSCVYVFMNAIIAAVLLIYSAPTILWFFSFEQKTEEEETKVFFLHQSASCMRAWWRLRRSECCGILQNGIVTTKEDLCVFETWKIIIHAKDTKTEKVRKDHL